MSVRNRTAPVLDRIRSEHLKNLPPVLSDTLARLFTRYLSKCKVPKQWKTNKTVLLYKKGDPHDIGNYHLNFDSVETESVMEALDNQGVPTQYIKVLRVVQQLYDRNFAILQEYYH
ncbi:hypothetical protein RB195_023831 [Necator americanus]|uniref:Uncharacterized protein n=1 Tax=Necator americanus TaxID=51031 RepID=A0ABR1EKU3_NECAM